MTTKYNKPFIDTFGLTAGLNGTTIPENFDLPSCGVEDVDRALFDLFNAELPLYYEHKGAQERVPVIFATGERAFILRRKKPLTDRHGALILPLVSIMRTGIEQQSDDGYGIGPGSGNLIVKQRIYKDSTDLANEDNQLGLIHQRNVTTGNKHVGPSARGYQRNIPVGTGFLNVESPSQVIETITIPNPRFFKASYEVTFWAQYLQQMNELTEAMLSSYSWNAGRAFRIETDKGYWFVASVNSTVTSGINFDQFTDEERLVKYSFDVSVNGYILNPKFNGGMSAMRRTVSSPKVSFDSGIGIDLSPQNVPVPSGNPADYLDEDFETANSPLPGSGIGKVTSKVTGLAGQSGPAGISGASAGSGVSARLSESDNGGSVAADSTSEESTYSGKGVSLGGHRTFSDTEVLRIDNFKDPFTGKVEKKIVKIKTSSTKFGEKVVNPLQVTD